MTYISLSTTILVSCFCLAFGFLSGAAWVAMRSPNDKPEDKQ